MRPVTLAAAGLALVSAAGWLGLRLAPRPFDAIPRSVAHLDSAALPAELPDPVVRYLRQAVGDPAPRIHSAVVTGRGTLRFASVTFPARLRFIHSAGRDYRHYIECTWFGLPLLRVNEWYLDGHARLELPMGVVENQSSVDQAANLNLWDEAVWFPSVLALDPRVRWEPIDGATARLIVPFKATEDSSIVRFDSETGVLTSIESSRYRFASDANRSRERFDALEWSTFEGVHIPSRWTLTWLDQGSPWLAATIEDVAYNVDVTEYIRASGP